MRRSWCGGVIGDEDALPPPPLFALSLFLFMRLPLLCSFPSRAEFARPIHHSPNCDLALCLPSLISSPDRVYPFPPLLSHSPKSQDLITFFAFVFCSPMFLFFFSSLPLARSIFEVNKISSSSTPKCLSWEILLNFR